MDSSSGKLYFSTLFDKNYLPKGLVLYDSLKKYCIDFELYILCLDDFSFSYFVENKNSYPQINLLRLQDVEENDAALKVAKSNRSLIEYYFTLSPCLPLYILNTFNLPHICTLDADIVFYSSPEPLFDNLKNYSIIITPHKFYKAVQHYAKWGLYNVSFQIFKNNATGKECLQHWKDQCIEWCYDKPDEENGRFADQKYLDNWEHLYPGAVKALNDDVSGLAVWNLGSYKFTVNDNEFYSNDKRLIFYHFHNFKIITQKWASNSLCSYSVKHQKSISTLYLNYWIELNKQAEKIGDFKNEYIRWGAPKKIKERLRSENSLFLKLSDKKIIYFKFSNFFERALKKISLAFYG